jgi:hypothetical protein
LLSCFLLIFYFVFWLALSNLPLQLDSTCLTAVFPILSIFLFLSFFFTFYLGRARSAQEYSVKLSCAKFALSGHACLSIAGQKFWELYDGQGIHSILITRIFFAYNPRQLNKPTDKMAPQLSEDEIDDLLYAARSGEKDELTTLLSSLSEREKVSPSEILISARDEGKSTCLHMATGNGHAGEPPLCPVLTFKELKYVDEVRSHLLIHADIVSHLLSHFTSRPKEERQAFLDAPNEYGNTGLHWAALGGHLAVVKLLVENGASVALANDKNYVPLDLASFGDKFEVVDYFLAQSGGLEEENAAGEDGLNKSVEGVQLDDEEKQGEEEEEEQKGKGKERESSS